MSRDDAYLLDMLLAAREVRQLATAMDRRAFEQSRVHQLALMKLLQDIGEAASRVSPVVRRSHPEIAWAEMVGMRNRLVHDYGGIDLDFIWDTADQDIVPLVTALERIVPPDTP